MVLPHRRSSLLAALPVIILGIAGGARAAEKQPIYAKVRFGSADKAAVYLRFEGDSLYVATSVEGLKTAKAVHPATGGNGAEAMSYAPVDLPTKVTGISKVTAAFGIRRKAPTPVSGDFTIRRVDKTGASWDYAYFAAGMAKDATTVEKALVIEVPSFERYTLGIEPKVEKGKVSIGLRVKADGREVQEVKRAGKPATARLEVRDASGKVIHKATGDLEKFGFTWGGPCYSVRVVKKGTYTVKASADLVPGGKPVTAQTTFTIR